MLRSACLPSRISHSPISSLSISQVQISNYVFSLKGLSSVFPDHNAIQRTSDMPRSNMKDFSQHTSYSKKNVEMLTESKTHRPWFHWYWIEIWPVKDDTCHVSHVSVTTLKWMISVSLTRPMMPSWPELGNETFSLKYCSRCWHHLLELTLILLTIIITDWHWLQHFIDVKTKRFYEWYTQSNNFQNHQLCLVPPSSNLHHRTRQNHHQEHFLPCFLLC